MYMYEWMEWNGVHIHGWMYGWVGWSGRQGWNGMDSALMHGWVDGVMDGCGAAVGACFGGLVIDLSEVGSERAGCNTIGWIQVRRARCHHRRYMIHDSLCGSLVGSTPNGCSPWRPSAVRAMVRLRRIRRRRRGPIRQKANN